MRIREKHETFAVVLVVYSQEAAQIQLKEQTTTKQKFEKRNKSENTMARSCIGILYICVKRTILVKMSCNTFECICIEIFYRILSFAQQLDQCVHPVQCLNVVTFSYQFEMQYLLNTEKEYSESSSSTSVLLYQPSVTEKQQNTAHIFKLNEGEIQ